MRDREIGEYYTLEQGLSQGGIRIFDMSRDKFHLVKYDTAIKHSWKGEGTEVVDALCAQYPGGILPPNTLGGETGGEAEGGEEQGHGIAGRAGRGLLAAGGAAAAAYAARRLAQAGAPAGPDDEGGEEGGPEAAEARGRLARAGRAASGAAGAARRAVAGAGRRELAAAALLAGIVGAGTYSTTRFDAETLRSVGITLNEDGSVDVSESEVGQANRESIADTYRGGFLSLPHKLILFRPRSTYRMGSAVLLKGGDELGSTLHGHHDFQLTDDVIHKTHIGHYTFYSKSVVREPKNMYIAEDVYCGGYIGGENTEFIREDSHGFDSAITNGSPSLIAVAVPEDYEPDACMSIVGDLSHHGIEMRGGKKAYATHAVLAPLRDFLSEDSLSRPLVEEELACNGVCFQGAEQTFNESSGTWVTRQHNTGHWGPSVYDGCASVRQGLYAHLKAPGTV